MTTVRAVFLLVLLAVVAAFRGIPVASYRSTQSALRAVAEINSVEELDAAVKAAGDKLMVVDYSTTWCGPCKVVAPKYDALSEKYPDVLFYKCIGDLTPMGGALLKAQGVRSVPAFHFWKSGSKVDTISGARIDDVEATVQSSK